MHPKNHPGRPLAGLKILDVGCGGGLLTEVSLSRKMQRRNCPSCTLFSVPNRFNLYPSHHVGSYLWSLGCTILFSLHFSAQTCTIKRRVLQPKLPSFFDLTGLGLVDGTVGRLLWFMFVTTDSQSARTGLQSLPSFELRPYQLCGVI